MLERGLFVDRTTIYRWVMTYAPELEKRSRNYLKPIDDSWRVDETYIKVKGKWKICCILFSIWYQLFSSVIYLTILGKRSLKPQRISQEIVFKLVAQWSAVIDLSPSLPNKVTISPGCKSARSLTSNIN